MIFSEIWKGYSFTFHLSQVERPAGVGGDFSHIQVMAPKDLAGSERKAQGSNAEWQVYGLASQVYDWKQTLAIDFLENGLRHVRGG